MKHLNLESDYSSRMNELIQQYNIYRNKAELENSRNGGNPSREEGQLYLSAAGTAEKIMNMNLSQPNVHGLWSRRKEDCEENVRRITDVIAPKKSPTPDQESKPKPTPRPDEGTEGNVPQKTAGGFVTKNACKDVTAETISKWYKDPPAHTLDDVIGMEEVKDMLTKKSADIGWSKLDSTLGISPFQSFLFYGPPGTGKTFTIEAFAGTLMKKGFKFIQLYGSDIHSSLVGVAEKVVQIAFQEAVDNEPVIIFVDELDDVCVRRTAKNVEGHEKRLTDAFLQAYNMLKSAKVRAVFIGATNHPGMIDEAVLDRINLVYVPLPDETMRKNYFESHLKALINNDVCSVDYMASATQDYSFRDIERIKELLTEEIKAKAIETYFVSNEDGSMDVAATDAIAADAISTGELCITEEMFDGARLRFPPADKTEINAELDAFEEKCRSFLM